MIKNYTVAWGEGIKELGREVDKRLADGWEL